ncbi:hypothetical protein [Devosia sp. SD17-2]|uniref:hypothetical protein n=1 Tax=Devosia sp. SD17-2 TaxID=2976459 RepID=UPI0023D88FD5|nr:hypothetical protein [Devosia sp. SD17-2]WEJ35018.1 hypothetical protein NYQ88_09540 [Devosia sp. SD17-2]
MQEEKLLEIYGTSQPPSEVRCVAIGAVELRLEDGAVRGLYFDGVEVLRGVDYPVRDANWGTYDAETLDDELLQSASSLTFRRRFRTGAGKLVGNFSIECSSQGVVDLSLDLETLNDIEVNRAGFVILHPAICAGWPIRVTHSNGRITEGVFPSRISAGQPFFDITAISQSVNGVAAVLEFKGEVFEMEDQRNWSDASYKTYCRPLGWERPYVLAAGTRIQQSIRVAMKAEGQTRHGGRPQSLSLGGLTGRPIPELAFALQNGWQGTAQALDAFGNTPVLLRIDLADDQWASGLQLLLTSLSARPLDMEVVVPDHTGEAQARLLQLHDVMCAVSKMPRHLTVVPTAYLKSYQPDEAWPSGLSLVDAAAMARSVFGSSRIGGGVLTNFTELNRCPTAAIAGDFVTHSTTAIVHAADDLSVMQTLEALPQIFSSAETLGEGRPCRLGLVSIGMRSNPYGASLAANDARVRRPMAMDDPRQQGLFAAAYMVGAVAATQGSNVEFMALASPSGPFGLVDAQAVYPAYHAFLGLQRLAGHDRRTVDTPQWCAAVAARVGEAEGMVLANLTSEPQLLHLPNSVRFVVLDQSQQDAKWLAETTRQSSDEIALGPYVVAFATRGSDDLFQGRL